MTKADLVEAIGASYPQATKKDISTILDLFFENVKKLLLDGHYIELRGFGTFALRVRKAREARNPKTGAKVSVPERRVPYFRVGRELKLMVKKGIGPAPTAPPPES